MESNKAGRQVKLIGGFSTWRVLLELDYTANMVLDVGLGNFIINPISI